MNEGSGKKSVLPRRERERTAQITAGGGFVT